MGPLAHGYDRTGMQIRLLGPFEVSVGDRPIALGGAKQRAVLAMLVLEANRTVTADSLIEGAWGEQPPRSAAKMLQHYVWRLRRALADGGPEIVTRGGGYELRVDPETVDVQRLERLVSEQRRAAAAGQPTSAARQALALFRGEPLADLVDEPFAAAEIRRLVELRTTARELAIDADLAAGRHEQIVGEIESLLAENPLRERLYAQQMIALYRGGRQAEALEAYRNARRTLVEEIGIEPGPELRRLHDAILRQDPSLVVEPAAAELPAALATAATVPLSGRDGELRCLRARWQRAAAGSGALVTVVGAYGMGKTLLAASIAAEVHREGAAVLYASGTGPPEAMLDVIARARETQYPTLVVVVDADRAPADVHAALCSLAPALGDLAALVVATGQQAAKLARLEPQDSIVLEPLDAAAVGVIASLYATDGGSDGPPVQTLLAASRGVPRRVHEAASEWARREAMRRVEALAGRAANGRSEAHALEAELAGSVVDLQRARERSGLLHLDAGEIPRPAVCPYQGLATFDADNAGFFFGREQLVAELIARIAGAPVLAVVGPSGSGKSSAVRAGLLPALAGGVLPGSDTWTRVLLRPGDHPMRALGRAADDLRAARRTVIAVDQFEEVFTACRDERERGEFIAALVRAARDPDGRARVVVALRANFYGRFAAYPELSRLLGDNVLVGEMSREELRRAIERPAQRVGLSVQPELVETLLADVEGRSGALPLLSTALVELWRARDGTRMRLVAYARSGGVQGAVARMAEHAFIGLDRAQQAVARTVLVRLAGERDDGAVVRRRIPIAAVQAPGDPVFAGVIAVLADHRLLTVSDGTVEVAHEALLGEWPRLRAWLEEDAHGRQLQRQISDAARAWISDDRDPGGLYRGARLSAALEWRSANEPQLNDMEKAFLDASRRAQERGNRRLRLALALVSLLLVAAVAASALALAQRATARARERATAAQALDVKALTEPALDRSLLLARQAVALVDSPATRDNLLAALMRGPAVIGVMRGDGDPLLSLAVSPHGRTLAVAENDGTVRFYDAATRRPVARSYDDGKTAVPDRGYSADTELRYSPDGTRLAVADSSFPSGGFIDLLDTRTHHRVARLTGEPRGAGGGAAPALEHVTFSRDSRVLIAETTSRDVGGQGNGIMKRWDARTGRVLSQQDAGKRLTVIGFLGGGRLLTSRAAIPELVARDASTLRPLRRLHVDRRPTVSTLSPDGRVVAIGAADGSVRFLDLRTGRVRTASGRHDAPVRAARFTADGGTLVTAGDDAKVMVWDVATATPRETLSGHSAPVRDLALSPGGGTAYTVSLDGSAIAWDLAGDDRLGRLFQTDPVVPGGPVGGGCGACGATTPDEGDVPPAVVATTPGGKTFAIPRADGDVDVFDGTTLALTAVLPVDPGRRLFSVAIAPDGRTLAATTPFGEVALWDLRTRRPLAPLQTAHVGPVWTPTFSADGRLMATAGADGMVLLWDVHRRQPIRRIQQSLTVDDVGLSPDGKTLAVTTGAQRGEGTVELYSVPRLILKARLAAPWGRWGRFSPDGHLFVVADHEGRLRRFDTRTWKPRSRPMSTGTSEVLSLAISGNGRTLATTSLGGGPRLWDLTSDRPTSDPLPGPQRLRSAAAFVRDATRLVIAYDDGRAVLWDLRPSAWAARACSEANRTLTPGEWNDALPQRPYAPACRTR